MEPVKTTIETVKNIPMFVNLNVEKLLDYMKLYRYTAQSLSLKLKRGKGFVLYSIKNGHMEASTYGQMCTLLGVDESILSIDEPENLYHRKSEYYSKPAYSHKPSLPNRVKLKSQTLEKYLKNSSINIGNLSCQIGHTSSYISQCIRRNSMDPAAYLELCKILNVDKYKFAYAINANSSSTNIDKSIVKPIVKDNNNTDSKTIINNNVTTSKTTASTAFFDAAKKLADMNKPYIVTIDSNGKQHLNILVDADEYYEMRSIATQASDLIESAVVYLNNLKDRLDRIAPNINK